MTAKNIGRPSKAYDQYYTPEWCVFKFLEAYAPKKEFDKKNILEPCAGDGAVVGVLRSWFSGAQITAMDIRPFKEPVRMASDWITADFLAYKFKQRFDLICTNPPYTLALEFCERSLAIADNVCMLVRQGFLSSKKRYKFFEKNKPSQIFILAQRPSFVYGSTDTADYCWICWGPNRDAETVVKWIPPVKTAKQIIEERDQIGLFEAVKQ